jgi:hypothetical protein
VDSFRGRVGPAAARAPLSASATMRDGGSTAFLLLER